MSQSNRVEKATALLRQAADLLSNESSSSGRTILLKASRLIHQVANAVELGGTYVTAETAVDFDKSNS